MSLRSPGHGSIFRATIAPGSQRHDAPLLQLLLLEERLV